MPYVVRKFPGQEKWGIYHADTHQRVAISLSEKNAKTHARIRNEHHKGPLLATQTRLAVEEGREYGLLSTLLYELLGRLAPMLSIFVFERDDDHPDEEKFRYDVHLKDGESIEEFHHLMDKFKVRSESVEHGSGGPGRLPEAGAVDRFDVVPQEVNS